MHRVASLRTDATGRLLEILNDISQIQRQSTLFQVTGSSEMADISSDCEYNLDTFLTPSIIPICSSKYHLPVALKGMCRSRSDQIQEPSLCDCRLFHHANFVVKGQPMPMMQ
jgi:hypothetical protein